MQQQQIFTKPFIFEELRLGKKRKRKLSVLF